MKNVPKTLLLPLASLICAVLFAYQNCGPARLNGSAPENASLSSNVGPESTTQPGAQTPNLVQSLVGSPVTVTGSTVQIQFRLANMNALSEDYYAFIHVVRDSANFNEVSDDFLTTPGSSTWNGTNLEISRTLNLPATLANGEYSIRVGLFMNHTPWTRATLNPGSNVSVDGDLRYIIGKIVLAR